jgi:phage baseplate assembly protein W
MADLALKRQTLRTEASDRMSIDVGDLRGDLSLRDGLDNIAQAIQNRLFTRLGEMSKLGHDDYGSELHKLIGQPNSWKAKARAELYIREALKKEKRVREVVEIYFPPADSIKNRSVLDIVIIVKVYDFQEQLKISISLNLAG